jgi:hypothetical protein
MILNLNNNKLTAIVLMTTISLKTLAIYQSPNGLQQQAHEQKISFTENKGQIHDQNYRNRPDVLFCGTDGKLVYHLRNNGISYQLNKVESWKEIPDKPGKVAGQKKPDQISIYRLDINWVNVNTYADIIKGKELEGYSNFYLENCPNGILKVRTFENVTYKNVYQGVDLKWYQKNGHLKYDYIVAPGGDYKQIQLDIQGAEKISINHKGELVLKTPLGEIIEQAPFVTQNGRRLKSAWQVNNNRITFEVKDVDIKQTLIIDPSIRVWGTYYGDSGADNILSCATDILNNVYIAGGTDSNTGTGIATSGSHQSALAGASNAFLAKFNSAGVRQWSTYYGGSTEYATCCSPDTMGNIYMVGQTSTTAGVAVATPGSHQPFFGGGYDDGFLVKFDSNGVRQWGTYYGGLGPVLASVEYLGSCATDLAGNIYIAGYSNTNFSGAISTSGSHQPTISGNNPDAFLVKFDPNGIRLWGTYYGGTGVDQGYCSTDAFGNVYLSGQTSSTAGIATSGSHQQNLTTTPGSPFDGFLAKFDGNGVRQWGTYYGSNDNDKINFCTTDASGNIFIVGETESNTPSDSIATIGSHQPVHGGGSLDAFLVKFDSSGSRQWGTYYGGSGLDYGYSCSADAAGNVYIAGQTSSTLITAMATQDGFQFSVPAGAFLVKFNANGVRQWGTFYGGSPVDFSSGMSCATTTSGEIYLAGFTDAISSSAITTPGAHQTTSGGSSDGFLVKFKDCVPAATPAAITGPTLNCPGAVHYSVSPVTGAISYSWGLPAGWLGSSNTNILNAFASGNGTLTVVATGTCGASSSQTLNVKILICNSIDEKVKEDEQLTVYPNPNSGEFELKLNYAENQNTKIEMYNITGDLIYTAHLTSDQIKIKMDTISSGVYFIKALSDHKEHTKKIVITK